MNYKKILKSPELRFKVLKALSFIPDRPMLKVQYKLKLGRFPDFKNPKRFTEKIQLYKMYYRNPIMGECVDKFRVRNYVSKKGFSYTLPELYGVYHDANEIEFDSLPRQFVMKTNDGGGGDNIIICRDKNTLDQDSARRKLNAWRDKKEVDAGREWAYTRIPESLIIVEEFLENEKNPEDGLEDYKFFCFAGEPFCIAYDGQRYSGHKRNFYDLEWNNLKIGSDCESFAVEIPKPDTLTEMITMAKKLSKDFPFVRVDLYSVKGKVYFGELTFYPWSGYVQYTPDEFDLTLGRRFDISSFLPPR